ncbi:trypsin alpha-3 [Zeugodacus cucurbitae]|uniref:Trypsin-3 n=1 Tax=Zeugodacus cucurbitae TaxID=28588 RepID=A0A0A1XDU0_ZEUCU|nr:trypsin alpha-3 [Zeugodacus cucurbitae]
MFQFYITLLGFFLVGSNGAMFTKQQHPLDGRIVGGEITTIQEHPYQASLFKFGSHTCGCSILDTGDNKTNGLFLVTAAHCVEPATPYYYAVKFGITYLYERSQVALIDTIVQHEKYNPNTSDYDIALIKLFERIPLSSKARPIRMASEAPAAGTSAVVTGWGSTTQGGQLSLALQAVTVDVVNTNVCAALYALRGNITERMLCAGVPYGGMDSCQGDSGGPLVADGVQIGVVSWGLGCALPNFPGVYSNVANLNAWINKTVEEMQAS